MWDWGDAFNTVVDYFGDKPIAAPDYSALTAPRAATSGPSGQLAMQNGCASDNPRGKYWNPQLQKYCYKSPRRRRRRLLTNSDFNDLMRIATLPNKDTVKIALSKAIGR